MDEGSGGHREPFTPVSLGSLMGEKVRLPTLGSREEESKSMLVATRRMRIINKNF